uniref:Uncharacterized protein n=1 Tax=Maylandia zebra TaxID=106582 RepID=A0A3P9CVZ4_9CICH
WYDNARIATRDLGNSNCYVCSKGNPEQVIVGYPISGFPLTKMLFKNDKKGPLTVTLIEAVRVELSPLDCLLIYTGQVSSKDVTSVDRTQYKHMFSYIYAYISTHSDNSTILHSPNTLTDSYWGGILKGFTASRLTRPIPHAYWMCNNTLRLALPVNWTGTCGLVTLAQELLIQQTSDLPVSSRRTERSAYSHNVYIDAIGVPRGIPNELKAQGEISAGFVSILPWIQVNKNVGWINYVYYNQQRLTNLTNTALKALGEQMSAASLMTMQNRMALDMLLAEKGGVCAMFEDVCCTFIPNNTAPDGSFTQAMNKLEALQIELRANAGHGQWLDKWMQDTFGKWKELIIAFVTVVTLIKDVLFVGVLFLHLHLLFVLGSYFGLKRTDS